MDKSGWIKKQFLELVELTLFLTHNPGKLIGIYIYFFSDNKMLVKLNYQYKRDRYCSIIFNSRNLVHDQLS